MPKKILSTPNGPSAGGPYSTATEANGFVFCSGMVAVVPGTREAITGTAAEQTHQVMKNIGAVLKDVGLGYADIVKTTIFLTDITEFANVNEVYAQYVGDNKPARSTFQVSALPGGYQVEIECIAAR